MTFSKDNYSLSQFQRIFLVFIAFFLAILLFVFRGSFSFQHPLEVLARKSIDPGVALANGRPTIFEFYADWCEACKEMAPAMLAVENRSKSQIDFVLLNIENVLWTDLIEKYDVNGIPQLNLFDKNGKCIGKSIGVRSKEEIEALVNSLVEDKELPSLAGVGANSKLDSSSQENEIIALNSLKPRSHGSN